MSKATRILDMRRVVVNVPFHPLNELYRVTVVFTSRMLLCSTISRRVIRGVAGFTG